MNIYLSNYIYICIYVHIYIYISGDTSKIGSRADLGLTSTHAQKKKRTNSKKNRQRLLFTTSQVQTRADLRLISPNSPSWLIHYPTWLIKRIQAQPFKRDSRSIHHTTRHLKLFRFDFLNFLHISDAFYLDFG